MKNGKRLRRFIRDIGKSGRFSRTIFFISRLLTIQTIRVTVERILHVIDTSFSHRGKPLAAEMAMIKVDGVVGRPELILFWSILQSTADPLAACDIVMYEYHVKSMCMDVNAFSRVRFPLAVGKAHANAQVNGKLD